MRECVRMQADALADGTIGVAATLADVPRISGDPLPTIANIYDSTRHGWVARAQVPRDENTWAGPCLAVSIPSPLTAKPSIRDTTVITHHMPGEMVTAIQYLRRDHSSVEALRDGSYVLRAVRGALLRFAALPIEQRTENGVRLMHLTKLETHEGPLSINDTTVTGLVLATWTTWETTPLS